ncbi:hypothetical protein [Neptuniibacter sp. QD37_11]
MFTSNLNNAASMNADFGGCNCTPEKVGGFDMFANYKAEHKQT